MAKMNPGFLNLKKSYLFIEIGKRVREYIAAHPDNKIIKMGIGDVTQPLAPVVVEAMKKAVRATISFVKRLQATTRASA